MVNKKQYLQAFLQRFRGDAVEADGLLQLMEMDAIDEKVIDKLFVHARLSILHLQQKHWLDTIKKQSDMIVWLREQESYERQSDTNSADDLLTNI